MAAYFWKWGMPVDANVAGNYLKELEEKNGELTPALILEESRDENAVLHNCFEWNDGAAAEKYRLIQAGMIIRNITVKIEKHGTESRITRAFVNISDEAQKDKGVFVTIEKSLQNESYKQQLLKNALYELQTFKNKFQRLSELANVFKAIDDFLIQMSDEK